jgi:hypothetical protein
LPEASARHVLLLAFANECLDRMHSPQVRNHLEKLVVAALPGAASFSGERSLEDMEREGAERNVEEVG